MYLYIYMYSRKKNNYKTHKDLNKKTRYRIVQIYLGFKKERKALKSKTSSSNGQ